MSQAMQYEISVSGHRSADREDFLTAVVECAGEHYDSADIDADGKVTIGGVIPTIYHLSRMISDMRMLDWHHIKIERMAP